MINYQKKVYGLQDQDGNLIGIDRYGCPWISASLNHIYMNYNIETVKLLQKKFGNQHKIVQITMELEEA
jgi:hypothetical protein